MGRYSYFCSSPETFRSLTLQDFEAGHKERERERERNKKRWMTWDGSTKKRKGTKWKNCRMVTSKQRQDQDSYQKSFLLQILFSPDLFSAKAKDDFFWLSSGQFRCSGLTEIKIAPFSKIRNLERTIWRLNKK